MKFYNFTKIKTGNEGDWIKYDPKSDVSREYEEEDGKPTHFLFYDHKKGIEIEVLFDFNSKLLTNQEFLSFDFYSARMIKKVIQFKTESENIEVELIDRIIRAIFSVYYELETEGEVGFQVALHEPTIYNCCNCEEDLTDFFDDDFTTKVRCKKCLTKNLLNRWKVESEYADLTAFRNEYF